MRKVARDIPLSELVLRKYERPGQLKERELSKKICLSLGVLQPGDSRDIVVDVLLVLLKEKKKGKELTAPEIEKKVIQSRKQHRLLLQGIAPSNVRRQIKRLRDVHLVEKIKNRYRITEFQDLAETFEHKIERYVLVSTLERIKEYLEMADSIFARKKR